MKRFTLIIAAGLLSLGFATANAQSDEEGAASMAELLRLTPMLGRRPSELSGGMARRVALARAIALDRSNKRDDPASPE